VLLGRDVTFLAVPIGRGQVYCYCDTSSKGTPRLQGEAAAAQLAELLADFAPPVPAILESLGSGDAVHLSTVEEVQLAEWKRGSVLLIGNAAHATSPNMAEGAAMALEDGLVLAECLDSGASIAQALDRFQVRRDPARNGFSLRRIAGIERATCHPP
jgi:2-polyprenyl-6-methoxyphenol hydroxylase-like FAD-dependent oxidoreductase